MTMNSNPENTPSPERNLNSFVHIEPELLAKLEVYVDILKSSNISEAELLMDHDMSDVSVENIVNSAVRGYIEGIESEFYGNRSEITD